jgi:acetyl-CoA synthetase
MTSSTSSFRAARDLLLRYRDDYDAALRSLAWPALDEFNWALDWFDVIAAEHPDRPALRILSDDDSDVCCRTGRCRRGHRRWPAGCAGSASRGATGCC